MLREIASAALSSTCQKRIVVCTIFDEAGALLACESNRCHPDGGVCSRMGILQGKESYDAVSACNWEHAEARAVDSLPPGTRPHRAVIHGHAFACAACEDKLRAVGVQVIDVADDTEGVGERG